MVSRLEVHERPEQVNYRIPFPPYFLSACNGAAADMFRMLNRRYISGPSLFFLNVIMLWSVVKNRLFLTLQPLIQQLIWHGVPEAQAVGSDVRFFTCVADS